MPSESRTDKRSSGDAFGASCQQDMKKKVASFYKARGTLPRPVPILQRPVPTGCSRSTESDKAPARTAYKKQVPYPPRRQQTRRPRDVWPFQLSTRRTPRNTPNAKTHLWICFGTHRNAPPSRNTYMASHKKSTSHNFFPLENASASPRLLLFVPRVHERTCGRAGRVHAVEPTTP